ncbi:serine/arginine repetitive matrix protein 1 isoform X1 [Drosophila guanche]|uniref:serine/arginine repetitive matrix protein 1 isoform X1 n=1 Tax=Drosophila guanche TaxID=7266 RepID=UPI00147266E8|nr:serine/arginine repetitive matrix protein 1 isoform X1 [Drosophila guanche]
MVGKLKVCIIGSEGWGAAIAATVSNNVKQLEGFDSRAHIYVYDELVRSKYLSEVMNNCHENIKYLPGIRLPENLIAVNDLLEAAKNADIMIFATPQHFVKSYCNILAGKVKKNAIALSMVKGLAHVSDGEIDLYSNLISQQLDMPCYSLMSANSAMEMAQGKLCELTIGCNDENDARLLTEVLQTDNCRVITIDDVDGVELCGTLKDIIALGAGFVDGLNLGENARVAALHLGVKEMMRFTMTFYPTAKMSTFFESCAVANSVASTYVDKNVTFAKSFITSGKTIQEIESNLLNGRKLLGPLVAAELNAFLEEEDMQDEFPLFTAIHRICQNEVEPETILETLRTHPDLSSSLSFSQFLTDESTTEDSLEKILETPPEPISALDKALAEAEKKKSFRELKENGSWHLVYDVSKAKKQTSIDPWQVNEAKELQISGWLESHDSNEPKNASGTQGSGENESIVGSTSGSDDCQGIGCTENADAEKLTDKTEKKLPVDKTWLRDQPPPMIIGRDDKATTETPFKDSNMPKVDAAGTKESVENHPRPFINKFQALNIKPKTGKQSKTDTEPASFKAKDESLKSEGFPKKLTKPTFSHTQQIRQQIEALTSKSKGNDKPESEKNVNASEAAGERPKTDVEKATKAETSSAQQEKPKSETISSTPEDKNQMQEDPVNMKVPKHKESSATGSEHQFVFDSLEDKHRFESILTSKSKKDRPSRIDGSESGNDYTQTWRYMSPPQPLKNLQVNAEDKQQEQEEHEEISETMEENKSVPKEQQQDSLTEENFEKWKQVEAEERTAKHSQTEENLYLSAEELIRRELEHHQKENYELAEQAEATRIPKENEGEGKQEMVPVDEEAPKDVDKRELLSEERKNDVQRPAISGQKKPHQSPDEANLRYFSFDKKNGKGHEWDWLHNKETPETKAKPVDERLSEYYVNENRDQQKLKKLNKQLQEVFKKHTEEADLGFEASGNSVESHESSETKPLALDPVTAQKRRDAQQPQTPVPGPNPTPAKAPPPMPKRQKIAEGSPQFQAAPRTIPPPSPQTLPLTPQEQQPHRKNLPIQSDALEQPPASHQADERFKAARGQKEIIDTPAANRMAHSQSDQQGTKKAEAPAFEVKKLMSHFLKRYKPETTKKVETPPNEVKNQRESAYELVNDPRTATKEHKPLPEEDHTPPIEKPSAQASPKEQKQLKAGEMTKKLRSMLRRDQEKKVGYKGKNPFLKEPDLQSHPPMDTSLEHDLARRRSTGQQLRRTVVVKPPFNPPLNPRVRIPRPPFDGRDRECHTLAMPAIWLNLKQTQTQTTLRTGNQVKQLSMAVHNPRQLQVPLGLLPRCPALNKLICAVQIGLLATFVARYRNRNK